MRNEMPDRANVPEVCTTEPKHVNLAHAIDGYASVVHALQNLVDRISNCEENLKDYESNYPSLEEVLNNYPAKIMDQTDICHELINRINDKLF